MATKRTNESARSQARTLGLATLQSLHRGFEASTSTQVNAILPLLFSREVHLSVNNRKVCTMMDAMSMYEDCGMLGGIFTQTKLCHFDYVPGRIMMWITGLCGRLEYVRVLTLLWGCHLDGSMGGSSVSGCDWKICEDCVSFL